MTIVSERDPELLERAAKLQDQITKLQGQIQELLRGKGLQVILPELHDPATGRVDAQKVAEYMGIPLKRLTEALDINYKAAHRNPSAEAIQPALQPVKRILEILHEFFQSPESIRIWLNIRHPDLDASALETILAKKSLAVLTLLENATAGIPV